MDAGKWALLENIFDELGIRPLVAVVPDNHDPELSVNAPDPVFWDKVRTWQAKGWNIAMHGYQHVFHAVSRQRLVLPFYERSEFAGLSLEEQSTKIRASWEIFEREGVSPTVWVAPAHCFDRLTLRALEAETPIRIVSDGIAVDQFYAEGFYWIPQQLWRLTEKPEGLWTVCIHPNTMSDAAIGEFHDSLTAQFSGRIISLADVELSCRPKSFRDHFLSICFWQRHRLNRMIEFARRCIT